jgi:hypothetical protein
MSPINARLDEMPRTNETKGTEKVGDGEKQCRRSMHALMKGDGGLCRKPLPSTRNKTEQPGEGERHPPV